MLAAAKACGPSSLLGHYSANALYGFVDRIDELPHVIVTSGTHRAPKGIRVHRMEFLDPIDRREHLGVPVTSIPLSLLDLAGQLDAKRTRRAIRRALGMGKVTISQLGLALERYPGRRGAKTLRQAVAAGAAPTKSDAESDVLDIILTAELEPPEVNRPLIVEGRRIVPDFRWPTKHLILEIDSAAWHTDPLARAEDRERQALLEARGETVLRVLWLDAVMAPSKFTAQLLAAGVPKT